MSKLSLHETRIAETFHSFSEVCFSICYLFYLPIRILTTNAHHLLLPCIIKQLRHVSQPTSSLIIFLCYCPLQNFIASLVSDVSVFSILILSFFLLILFLQLTWQVILANFGWIIYIPHNFFTSTLVFVFSQPDSFLWNLILSGQSSSRLATT